MVLRNVVPRQGTETKNDQYRNFRWKMGFLYVNENGATIGVEANQCTVNYKDGMKRLIPIESLDGITIMGRSQMTTQCAEECMSRGV